MNKKIFCASVIVVALLVFIGWSINTLAITAQCGGSASRCVFVTSKTYTGNLGGLDGADKICQQLAADAKLGGTYKAYLSARAPQGSGDNIAWVTLNVKDRLENATVPYKLVDGTTIANNWTDLTSKPLLHAININEKGGAAKAGWVWTGSISNGMATSYGMGNNYCGNWQITNICCGSTGWNNATDNNPIGVDPVTKKTIWAWGGEMYARQGCRNKFNLYCFQQGTSQTITGAGTANAAYSVQVTPVSGTNSVKATNQYAFFYFNLTNTGTQSDKFKLTLNNVSGLDKAYVVPSGTISLKPNATKKITVMLRHKVTGTYQVIVTAQSQNDATKTATFTANFTVGSTTGSSTTSCTANTDCQWCGNTCIKKAAGLNCIDVAPAANLTCGCKDGVCKGIVGSGGTSANGSGSGSSSGSNSGSSTSGSDITKTCPGKCVDARTEYNLDEYIHMANRDSTCGTNKICIVLKSTSSNPYVSAFLDQYEGYYDSGLGSCDRSKPGKDTMEYKYHDSQGNLVTKTLVCKYKCHFASMLTSTTMSPSDADYYAGLSKCYLTWVEAGTADAVDSCTSDGVCVAKAKTLITDTDKNKKSSTNPTSSASTDGSCMNGTKKVANGGKVIYGTEVWTCKDGNWSVLQCSTPTHYVNDKGECVCSSSSARATCNSAIGVFNEETCKCDYKEGLQPGGSGGNPTYGPFYNYLKGMITPFVYALWPLQFFSASLINILGR